MLDCSYCVVLVIFFQSGCPAMNDAVQFLITVSAFL